MWLGFIIPGSATSHGLRDRRSLKFCDAQEFKVERSWIWVAAAAYLQRWRSGRGSTSLAWISRPQCSHWPSASHPRRNLSNRRWTRFPFRHATPSPHWENHSTTALIGAQATFAACSRELRAHCVREECSCST